MPKKVKSLEGQFAEITLYGARQVGKPTMIHRLFEEIWEKSFKRTCNLF